ncbi:PqqD family protein [Qipengyuania psychrotolerans]|uniref:PqqD family protein n=1 Tax=Qipengyuania psychrotolerans TaxID=2867238 RepID=A0ABX8ZH67_9SPHN|nr:PqqD family protein [Qipengyuania psychrotolerans]QZD86969.1 PqqD family protein [Qipengyuania psychrotolerans]
MAVLKKLKDNFVATQVDDEVLIVDLDGGELFSLSGTGRAVWEAIDGKRDADAIAALLAAAYDADETVIAGDVRALITSLREAALIAPVK